LLLNIEKYDASAPLITNLYGPQESFDKDILATLTKPSGTGT
jgi:hypothetical protein